MVTNTLQRFIDAQESSSPGVQDAIDELRAGRKRTHWIWFVFPQLRGLGSSPAALMFALNGTAEATSYLRHGVLRARLLEAAETAAHSVQSGVRLTTLMGADIDVLKLVSSMTLFGHLARRLESDPEIGAACQRLANAADTLLAAAESGGVPACAFTLRALAESQS